MMAGPRCLPRRRARSCPVCLLTRYGVEQARPADLFAFEVGPRAAGLEPLPELRR
jgi:hypothetical protein